MVLWDTERICFGVGTVFYKRNIDLGTQLLMADINYLPGTYALVPEMFFKCFKKSHSSETYQIMMAQPNTRHLVVTITKNNKHFGITYV